MHPFPFARPDVTLSAMVITIDGPAGSGKSTAARQLAARLGVAYLDTGATYRAVTLKALREGVNLEAPVALARLARRADIRLVPAADGLRVLLDGQDVSREIRSAEVSDNTHYLAGAPEVRAVLVELQRRIGGELGSFVTEGRDQGSVVFPQADVKFYLDASAEVRARRRHAEMTVQGQLVSYEQVLQGILQRDQRDRGRAVAPLVRPPGAVEIDTSDLTIEQMTTEMLKHVEAAR